MNEQADARRRYTEKRMAKAFDYLGGMCKVCGSTDQLEFDHVDPTSKLIDITTAIMRECWSWARLVSELEKCQLLCSDHHKEKSRAAYGVQSHGTYWKYRKYGCRCTPCVLEYQRKCRIYKGREVSPR